MMEESLQSVYGNFDIILITLSVKLLSVEDMESKASDDFKPLENIGEYQISSETRTLPVFPKNHLIILKIFSKNFVVLIFRVREETCQRKKQ